MPWLKIETLTDSALVYPTDNFIFASFTDSNYLMSVKNQIPSSCKFYSFYEETPEEFLYGTDVDS